MTPLLRSLTIVLAALLVSSLGQAPSQASARPGMAASGLNSAAALAGFSAAAAPAAPAARVRLVRARRLANGVLVRVNRLRRSGTRCAGKWKRPVRAVRHNDKLAYASRVYARRMAVHSFFGHWDGVTGNGPGWRATNAGYRWRAVGENVAAGYATPRAVIRAWRKSPGHCRNMMNPRWRHLGVGWYHGSSSRWGTYWGQLFGKPR